MMKLVDATRVRIDEIKESIITARLELPDWEIRTARYLGPDNYEYESDWCPSRVGEIWGVPGVTVFFRRRLQIPAEWSGLRVALQMETGGEGLLSIDGTPYHGLDDNRSYILLSPVAKSGESMEITAEMKTGGYWEWKDETGNREERPYIFKGARLITIDRAIEEAYYDFMVTREAALAVKDSVLQKALLTAIYESLLSVDFRHRGILWVEQLTTARKLLRTKLDQIHFGDTPAKVFFSGHSHIDLAWLWPYRETVRKCGRTYATVTALMEEFPDYYFNCSQVPLYIYTREFYPAVYEKIKARIKEGRFEPIGGTWVEHDTNLLSGESLVRQCLYGQRFFRNELGVRVRVGWLPDVFGYSWALPQIYKKAGLEYFMTSKISWNDTNKFPYGTFWWEGSDGTRIFTHFICGTYNASVKPQEMLELWDAYPSKLECPQYLSTYGWGDGGGGPTREMIEAVSRMAAIPGIPKGRTGRVHDFFDGLAASTQNLPVWNGELYFELHRGTYTSQARNKRDNRKSELLFRDTELLCSLAASTGKIYPQAKLTAGWETILLNQFHDVLPGSSVTAVYEDSREQYRRIQEEATIERREALQAIAAQMDTTGSGMPVMVFNTLSWNRTDIVRVELPDAASILRSRVIGPDGQEVPSQIEEGKLIFTALNVPSMGAGVYHVINGESTVPTPFLVNGSTITSPFYELEIGDAGILKRVFDKLRFREVLPPGDSGNLFQFFEDKPANYEAWDIDPQYQAKVWGAAVRQPLRVVANGPVRLVLQVGLTYGQSTIDQRIILYAHSPRIDFVTKVDWHERKTLLKVAFPVMVRSARATYEIAFGAIERPTHWNTSWDWAKFEVSGHKWADLSEADYGVSILNDCKYGWDIRDNTIRLSLLRSPRNPDPEADQGVQEFTYSFFPHAGDWRSGTVQEGYHLNVPLLPVVTGSHPGMWGKSHSFLSVNRPNVIIDTVKKAEDSEDTIIRVYEAYGARGPVRLQLDRPVAEVWECNLLEENEKLLDISGTGFVFEIKPFEVRTFKVRVKN